MNTKEFPQGQFFSEDLQRQVKERFCHVDSDPEAGPRVFFENAGGSLRLKSVNEAYATADAFPDCDSRKHKRAKSLKAQTMQGFADARVMFNAPKYGQIIWETSSSKVMFTMVRAVLENAHGTNVVTTRIEHPSSFDSTKYYAARRGMEFRVAEPNTVTGGVDVESIIDLVDENTALLNVIYASNHTGAVLDIEEICKQARAKNPQIYILSDAVQHMPHGLVDVQKLGLDGINFASYKIFGCRGFGMGYISERLAGLDHAGIAGNLGDPWEIGGAIPAMNATVTAIVDHVCWIGSHYTDSQDRRELYETGMFYMEMQERALMHHMLEGSNEAPGLRHIPGVRIAFDKQDYENRDFILPLILDNIDMSQAVEEYQKRGIIVYDRQGSNYYSTRSLHPFGLEAIIRVSPIHCHEKADVEKFLKATAEIAKL